MQTKHFSPASDAKSLNSALVCLTAYDPVGNSFNEQSISDA